MTKIAIIEKYPSTYQFDAIFPFEYDKYALVPEKQDKVLKRDVTLDIDALKEEGKYDFIILVGKEPCKLVADIRSVSEYQGYGEYKIILMKSISGNKKDPVRININTAIMIPVWNVMV